MAKPAPRLAHGVAELSVGKIARFTQIGIDRVVLKNHEHAVEEIGDLSSYPFSVRL